MVLLCKFKLIITCLVIGTLLCDDVLTQDTGSNYYLGFYKSVSNDRPSVVITTTESQPVSYSIEIPGIGYYHNGTITANNEDIVHLPSSAVVSSRDDQDKGMYLKTSTDRVTVIGQNVRSFTGTVGTYLSIPTISLCTEEYVYYGISVTDRSSRYSVVLIVGTENNTMMNLAVTQPVTIKVDDIDSNLTPGRQYAFVINRLQTVYVVSEEDLTGTKIVTNKPVSVFSGHECANVLPSTIACDHLIEQVPPTISWGRVYYTAPLATRRSYTIRVLAAYNSTNVDIHCNDAKTSYNLDEGKFISRTLVLQEYCMIHSNKEVLVAQFSHGWTDDNRNGDPMMTLVPATIHYSNEFSFSTFNDPLRLQYNHYINIVVLPQYYQPDMIYLISGGVNNSLDSQIWIPVKVNNVTEAYAAAVTVSEGVVEIVHTDKSARLTTIVYGFIRAEGYGHPGGLRLPTGCVCSLPNITTHPSSHVIGFSSNNHNLSLTCEADGATSYNWERENGSIPSGAIGVNTNTLTIINLQPEDVGSYRCVASNDCGRNFSEYATIDAVVRPTCPTLNAPDNGMIDCSLGADGLPTAKDTCRFTCNSGFVLSGSARRRCRVQNGQGRWNGQETTCIPVRLTCPRLDAPDNGTIGCSLGVDGLPTRRDTCRFTCNPGFVLSGSTRRTCRIRNRQGRWNGQTTICAPECSPLSDPQNGMVLISTDGQQAVYSCNPDYRISGIAVAECISGKWSSPPPTCGLP